MDLFTRKKQNTDGEEEIKIRNSDLFVRQKKEKRPAKVYGLLFIFLCVISLVLVLLSDREPEEEIIAVTEVTAVVEELPDEPQEEVRIPDYDQQPGQAVVDYPRYQINSIIYEIRNDAAFVVGTVGNTKNVKYLTIDSSVRYLYPVVEISEGAFSGCTKLQRVHIPDSVIVIRNSAFENCKRLEYVRLSEALITVGERAFAGCEALKSLKFPATVRELRADTFEGDVSLSKLSIPAGCTIPEGGDPFGLGEKLKIEIY